MKQPIISVIIPIYNVEQYLVECIESVQMQSLKDIEIILIDDGSLDSCPKLCDIYKENDDRIRVIHKQNGGLSSARNTGLNVAQGKYIFFLDSDDWLEKDTLKLLYNQAELDKSEITVCNINLCKDSKHKNPRPYWPFFKSGKVSFEEIIPYFLIEPCWVWNKLYRKDFLKNNNLKFIEGIVYEDVPFFVNSFLIAKHISVIPNYLYNYRTLREDKITTKPSLKHLDIVRVRKEIEHVLENNDVSKQIKKNFYKWTLFNYAWMYDHLPKKYRTLALREIEKLPNADDVLSYLNIKRRYISLFFIDILSIKKVASRYDILLFNKIPVLTLKRNKK